MNNNLIWERERPVVTALLLAIFLLGMGLRLYGLDADSLWADEIFTASRAQRDLGSLLTQAAGDVHPPLLYTVIRFFVFIAGDSEFVLRFQAMLFGSFSILLVHKLGQILWTRKEGLIAAFLLAVSPYHVQYSQEARQYALMIFLALLSLFFLIKALEKNRKGLWVGFSLCTSLSIYNHYFAFLLLPAQLILAALAIMQNWLSPRRDIIDVLNMDSSSPVSIPARQTLNLVLSLTLIGVLFLPWVSTMSEQIFGSKIGWEGAAAITTPRVELSPDYLSSLLTTYTGMDGIPLLLSLSLFSLGLVYCSRKQLALILSSIAVPFIFAFLVPTEHAFDPRHLIFVVPVYLLTTARGLVCTTSFLGRFPRATARDHRWLIALSSSLVVVLGLANVASLRDYYRWEKEDWRSAAQYLKVHMIPGDLVLADGVRLFGGDAIRVQHSLSFYLARHGMTSTPILRVRRGLAEAMAQNLGEGRGQVWAVIYHDDGLSTGDAKDLVTVVDFQDVSMIRLQEQGGDLVEDSVAVLHVLLDLLPALETHFSVHLALADIYLRTGGFDPAESHISIASQVMPDTLNASRRLARMRTDFDQVSYPRDEDIRYPLWRSLGLQVALLGYEVGSLPDEAGGALHITLWWQALTAMDKDYSGFVHVLDSSDRIWTQEDRLLSDGESPTSAWEMGKIVKEEYELRLPADAAPGDYRIQTGIYDWETGQRLPVWDEHLRREDQDAIALTGITVSQ
jgi:mannosyltransferase